MRLATAGFDQSCDWDARACALCCVAPEIPMTDAAPSATKSFSWRLPIIICLCGCAISVLTFGPRSSLGFFLSPLSQANGWGRDVFAMSLALQNLIWGLGQPFAGAIADKYGAPRVLSVGIILYALGLYLTASATTPGDAEFLGRHSDRPWPLGIGGADGDRRARQDPAGELALRVIRRGDGGGLVRPVPVLADCRAPDGRLRLAANAGDLLVRPAVRDSAGDGADCTAQSGRFAVGGRAAAIVEEGAVGSIRAPFLRAAGARLLHLRLPARVRHGAPAELSRRSRHLGRDRRLDAGDHRPVQHRRLARLPAGSRPSCPSDTSCRSSISRARSRSSPSSRCRRRRRRR